MPATTARPSALRRRLGAVALGASVLAVACTGTAASAKEIGSGSGTGITTTACSPVTSLITKGDPKVGETGLASIAVTYGVKACDKGQTVKAAVSVYQYTAPSNVLYDAPDAPLSGKFTVFGVKLSTSYVVKVTVTDAATGAVVGTGTAFAAAVPKGV